MRRREFIAAAVVGFAGCSADDDDESTPTDEPTEALTESPTPTATPTATPSPTPDPLADGHVSPGTAVDLDGRSIVVRDVQVQRSVFAAEDIDAEVVAPTTRQFVVATVVASRTDEDDPDPLDLDLQLTIDGETVGEPSVVVDSGLTGQGRRRLAFPAPIAAANSASIRWNPGEGDPVYWDLPNASVAALVTAPEFDVTAFDLPEEVYRGTDVDTAVTVENTGERSGVFRATLGEEGLPDRLQIAVPVPAGESITVERTLRDRVTGDVREVSVRLAWGVDEIVRPLVVLDPTE